MTLKNEAEGLPAQQRGPWCSYMPCSLGGQWSVFGWESTMASGKAAEDLVDVMKEGTGRSPLSEWYHLLYFHSIKIPVLCLGGLKLLEVIEETISIASRSDIVLWRECRLADSNASPGQYSHCLIIVRWMVEVYQTLPSSSTFQYCTVRCMYARSCLAHSYSQTACRNLSTNFNYANALNNLTFYIAFGLASLGYLYHSLVTLCDRVGCSSSSPEQLREMLFKKSTMSSISISVFWKTYQQTLEWCY